MFLRTRGRATFILSGAPSFLRLLDGVETLLAADENLPVGDRGRGVDRLAQRVGAQHLVFGPRLDDEGVAVLARQKDFAVEGDGRSGEGGRDGDAPALVLDLAGARVEARHHALVGQEVDVVAVENRRRDVGRALRVAPDDVGVLQLARRAEADGVGQLGGEARRDDDHVVAGGGDRRGDGVALKTLAAPQLLTRRRVVRDDRLGAARDQLGALARVDEERRGPAHLHLARRAPDLFAGLLVERDDGRVLALLLIGLHDDEVLVEHRRGRRPHAERAQLAERGLPRLLAAHVVGVEPLGAEVGVDHLPVGGGRRRGVGAFAMAVVVGRALPGSLLPEDAPRVAVERDDLEGVLAVGADAVGVLPLLPLYLVRGGLRAGDDRPLDGRGHEDALAPDDGARMPLARQRGLPADVLGLAPFLGEVTLGRDAGAFGAAPLRPVRLTRRRPFRGREGERGQ